MAKAKASRKGKKAWRKNIGTTEHDAFVERTSREDRSGGPLDTVPDQALFFVDKSKDEAVKRKVDKHRSKVLHCDSILRRASLVPPVHWAAREKGVSPAVAAAAALQASAKRKKSNAMPQRRQAGSCGRGLEESSDPWDGTGGKLEQEGGDEGWVPGPNLPSKKLEAAARRRRMTEVAPSPVSAVEVDAPGCSYNPSLEDHQEALGVAVAQELGDAYRTALQPEPVSLTAPSAEHALLDEEDLYFLEAEDGEEGEEGGDEEEGDGADVMGNGGGARAVRVNKLRRADLNRRLRRRAAEQEASGKLQAKRMRADISRLEELQGEVEGEEVQAAERRRRRELARSEKLAEGPPRLGRHKFKPAPVQVLLTEEVTGSLRQLKGCYTLARERFKSIQRRGLVEPRVLVRRRAAKAKNRRIVEQGAQGEREREMHAEILAMRDARRAAAKKGAAAAKEHAEGPDLLLL